MVPVQVPASDDVRITKGLGSKDYGLVRVSMVTNSAVPPSVGFFDYSSQFLNSWTQNHLHTGLKQVVPGEETVFQLGGRAVKVKLPMQGAGVAGVLIADPCVSSPTGLHWVGCQFLTNSTPSCVRRR